jgi:hypothetical protein
VHFDPEYARKSAASARAGREKGLPIRIKDVLDTADMPSQYGSPFGANWQLKAGFRICGSGKGSRSGVLRQDCHSSMASDTQEPQEPQTAREARRALELAIARSESAEAMVTQASTKTQEVEGVAAALAEQRGGRVSGCSDRPVEEPSKLARTMPDDRKQREVKCRQQLGKTRARRVWGGLCLHGSGLSQLIRRHVRRS